MIDKIIYFKLKVIVCYVRHDKKSLNSLRFNNDPKTQCQWLSIKKIKIANVVFEE